MPRFPTLGVALSLIVGVVLAGGPRAEPSPSSVTLTDVTAAQGALIEWALGLFEAAGLSLPPIDFVGHDTTEPCWGRPGAHTYASGRSTVHLCTRGAGRVQEFLYLHEIAHAWDRHALTDDRRQAFLDRRGLREWRNDDPERWHDRGAEHAAEIIMWGLMDRPINVVRIDNNTCAELLDGYLTLVGRPPLHGFTDRCTQ